MSRQRLLIIVAAIVVVFVLDVVLVKVLHVHHKTTTGKPVAAAQAIPGSGGTKLAGRVWQPAAAGKYPLVVMPASWGAAAEEYQFVAKALSDQGYVVVAYAQRGFAPSDGQVDFAGEPTQADVTSVITWALANTRADPAKIGVMGVSYGAGASLLAAERDNRIKAVVAMSGWTDLEQAFFPNNTPNTQAIKSLFGAATKRFTPEMKRFEQLFDAKNVPASRALLSTLAPSRSAITNVAALNRNHPAVMMANDFQDSYFAPNMLVDFYDKLTVPKRLQLAVGDHGSQELPGLKGGQAQVFTDATKWLNHYLRGADNGIQNAKPVQLKDVSTGEWRGYSSWPGTGQDTTLYLGSARGPLTNRAAAAWSATITTGTQTAASTAPIQIGVADYHVATGVEVSQLPPTGAGVWNAPPVAQPTSIDGTPTLHLTVTPATPSATVFGYLYDADPSGSGSLITSAPYTISGAAGTPQTIDLALRSISWTVPAGHHLVLVIDTVDRRFTALGKVGQPLVLSSPAGDPSRLALPVA